MLAFMTLPAAAQEGDGGPRRTVPAGKAPRLPDGKPDLTGVWSPEHTFIYDISVSLDKDETLPMQPWAEKLTKEHMSQRRPGSELHADGRPASGAVSMADNAKPGVDCVSF
jgi:hypothetical protein